MLITPQLQDSFWSKVEVRGSDECWLWRGAQIHGHGRLRNGNSVIHVSRVSWQLAHGDIPPYRIVLHTCDNTLCVNPNHLELRILTARGSVMPKPPKAIELWERRMRLGFSVWEVVRVLEPALTIPEQAGWCGAIGVMESFGREYNVAGSLTLRNRVSRALDALEANPALGALPDLPSRTALRSRREALDLSQRAVARAADISRSLVDAVERMPNERYEAKRLLDATLTKLEQLSKEELDALRSYRRRRQPRTVWCASDDVASNLSQVHTGGV